MRSNSRFWYLLSVACFLAAVWFWLKGNEVAGRRKAERDAALATNAPAAAGGPAPAPAAAGTPSAANAPAGAPPPAGSPAGAAPAAAQDPAARPQGRFPYRLSNTSQPLGELGRSDTAILLDNAFIDTASQTPWEVPESLRSKGDPESYIVQSRHALDPAFYAELAEVGAEFVSYIPNNAALVRAPAEAARHLAGATGIRAVLPYEPYYKIARAILPAAVEQGSLPDDRPLNVVLFPGREDVTRAGLENLGALVVGRDRSPFGPVLTVVPHPDTLVAMAGLPGVQRVEYASGRTLLNDLVRVRVGASVDPVTPTNYLNLSGTNITLNLNDTGVDAGHLDLAGRVSSTDTNTFTLLDPDGHGTHVAGTIISSGGLSIYARDLGDLPPAGSTVDSNFRGVAMNASLFVLPIDLQFGPLVSDTDLQERAALNNFVTLGRTNALVSNNSWGYLNAPEYNLAAANYDAAVRDALPERPGPQPVLYVFAAGNNGFGNTNGLGGDPDSILSPATAKNVITVGAIENWRNVTNEFYLTNVVSGTNLVTTNAPFLGYTDTDSQVAAFSSRGNVGIGTEGEFGRFKPDLVAPGTFVVSTFSEQMTNVANPQIPYLGAEYRYDSGTSMAAPAVSGVLALMQEFFEQHLKRRYSPALLKALLINGARLTSKAYDFCPTNNTTYAGWGLVSLTNSLPAALDGAAETSWPLRFFDQDPADAIPTGRRRTWKVALSTNGLAQPLRVTLVWTDPPGNPAAGVKLVNDLDLVVTNLDSGEVFYGNNIPTGFDFNPPATDTNAPAAFDFVNNVENVFLQTPLGTNYSITVLGRRVNVNAVTANTSDIVQDFALVIASGNGDVTDTFTSITRQADAWVDRPAPIGLTNGVPLLQQRVGANFQLAPSTNGNTNQWRFYVFTNAFFTNTFTGLTNGSNVAFITFLPPNLARARNLDADIDLYVSKDPALTNLDAVAIAGAWTSRERGGTESVVFTNAAVGLDQVYYLGVKSEDQQGAEFGVIGISTDVPFDEADNSGNRILHGMPPFAPIPDGTPDRPGAALLFAIGTQPQYIARVIVTNDLSHQSIGDLIGTLSHHNAFSVLNDHNRFNDTLQTFFHLVYDDSGGGQFQLSRPTDGPGSLNNFMGDPSAGVWMLAMVDDSHDHTGRVESLTLRVEPELFLTNGVNASVLANQWAYFFQDVPPDATTLTITLSGINPALPLNLYIKRGAPPTDTDYDKFALINPPGGALSIGLGDVPPLNAGRYFIGVFNPNAQTVNFTIRADIVHGTVPQGTASLLSVNTPSLLLDDAVTRSSIFVPINREIADVRVGVRIDDVRASDLVLHLVSPQGTRVLLAENRGRTNTLGYGISDLLGTNILTVLTNTFEKAAATNYFVGDTFEGWKVETNMVTVRNDPTLAAQGTNFLVLRGGTVGRVLPTVAGRSYRLNFQYRLNPGVPGGIVAWWPVVGNTASDIAGGHTGFMSDVAIVPGEVEDGFGFNGVTSTFTVADNAAFDFTGNFTMEFWVNPDPVQNAFANIARKEDPAVPSGFGIEMDANPNSNFYYAGWKNSGGAPGGECWTTAGFQLVPGTWQHVAVVKSNDTRLVYINGALIASAACVGSTNTLTANNAPLQFGYWSGRPNSQWHGVLDELSVYNRALSGAEIEDIVLSGGAGKCGNVVTPVTCSSGAQVLIDGVQADIAPGFFSWATRSVPFIASRNGSLLEIAPIGGGMLLDYFTLIENRVTSRPDYTVFTDNTNLATTLVKFAAPPYTNSPVAGVLTNNLVLDDGFENTATGQFTNSQFVSGWLVSTGAVQVFGVPNPIGQTNLPAGFAPHSPGKKFLALNGGWDDTGQITNWVPGSIVTNINTTANGQYILTFLTAEDPTLALGITPPNYPANHPVVTLLTNGVVATNIIVSGAGWKTNTFLLDAVSPTTSIEFRSFTTNGAFLDMVQVLSLNGGREAYFLPEESLKPFIGELALGNWTLEALDNRVGVPSAPRPPLVLSWKLDFTFANTNAPAALLTFCPATTNVASLYDTNCVPITNSVAGGEMKYFMVDVPRRATMATNILAQLSGAGNLQLLYNRDALPVPGDFTQDLNNGPGGGELLLLTTAVPPGLELRPGQRYYLGVTNTAPAGSNTFQLTVAFDQTDTNLISVVTLTNGLCYSNSIPATNALDYYAFNVSAAATAVTFDLTPQNGNADLVVRRAIPVPDPLPAPISGRYDYISQNPGTNLDEIIVTSTGQPVPLSPGLWYLGVYNKDTNPVVYSVCATESAALPYNIIRLTNDVPVNFSIPAGAPLTNFFLLTIDQTNAAVAFWLYNLNNPADLFVDQDFLPDPNSYLFRASGTPASPAQVIADTNVFPADLNGDWYLAVVNQSTNDLTFTVLASFNTNGLPTNNIVIDPQLVITNGSVCLSWASVPGQVYYVEAKTNLTDPTWTVVSPAITATNTVTTYCLPISGQQMFFRVTSGTVTNAPTFTFSSLALTPGGFVLNWTAPPADRFQVQYATNLPPAWFTFTNIITSATGNFTFTDDGTQTGGLGAMRFYRLLLLP